MYANWNYPTQILAGAGASTELAKLCHDQKLTAPLLVTDSGLAALPFIPELVDQLKKADLKVSLFPKIKPNPTGSNITEGIAAFKKGQHDGVIAVGGGSALDAGKAIALMANQSCSLFEVEDIGDNWRRIDTNAIVKTIAIPTTAGTGSEVGRASVIIKESEQRKAIIFHPQLLPTQVILDPLLTTGLPPILTAATGMDALSHALEAFCAKGYHPMAEGIAIEAIRLVKENLPTATHDGQNIQARTQMLVASTMGATAFQKGLGAMHALAHPLGAVFDAHHGMLNAILMPYVLKANFEKIKHDIGRLATYLNISHGFDGFLEWILNLRQELNIPHQLSAIITADIDYEMIGEMASKDATASTNPIIFTTQEYSKLLASAHRGHL